ncbi:MAG: hypothetical protein VXW14_05415 [Candidatus Thermoplasmatota archaeon]|nr:hypothetical protein [Candidatus Thermoplasmatota archaeon]
MTGCFDNSVGDAEGSQDSDSSSDSTGESTNTANSNNAQARTWYSSGGVAKTNWDDGHYSGMNWDNDSDDYRYISSSGQRCISYGPFYDSSTGELIGQRCNEWGYPESSEDWNLTDCTQNGGVVVWQYDVQNNSDYYRYAPNCRISFATINSTAGEALMIYEWSGFSISSTCDGVSAYTGSSALSGKEYVIAPGTALDCTHELYRVLSYTYSQNNFDTQSIWSIVYAVQDTTVV